MREKAMREGCEGGSYAVRGGGDHIGSIKIKGKCKVTYVNEPTPPLIPYFGLRGPHL